MSPLDKLIQYFEAFPGVGARQAKRFTFHVLNMSDNEVSDLAKLISEIKNEVVKCISCHRFFTTRNSETICTICNSKNRNHNRLLVVERDADVQVVERAGVYDGLYFVFGGTVPLLNHKDNGNLRAAALKATVETRAQNGLSEIIIGFSINPDGENTTRFVESILSEIVKKHSVLISYLGRGLSTGSELEYADTETIKSALQNRTKQTKNSLE